MCLWYVQMCPQCETITPLSNNETIQCLNPRCVRKSLDPAHLNEAQRMAYLDDSTCSSRCVPYVCGLSIRFIECGHNDAVREYCRDEGMLDKADQREE